MMIRKTPAAFFVSVLIAGSAQAAPIYSGDGALGEPSAGTVYDYLCPGANGTIVLYQDWPFSLPPAPDCIAFGGTTGLVWSVTDYPLTHDVTLNNDFPSTSSSYSSSGGFEQTWTAPNVNVVRVPEPQTLAIFLAGLGLIALMACRKKST